MSFFSNIRSVTLSKNYTVTRIDNLSKILNKGRNNILYETRIKLNLLIKIPQFLLIR